MGFNENSLLRGYDKKLNEIRKFEKEKNIREQAYRKAGEILEIDRIDENEFIDLYGELVKKDLRYVKEMEEKFKILNTPERNESAKMAKIFEAIVHEQIEINNWLGENAFTKKAARFDDIKNGIDEIVEFKPEDISKTSHLALAIDVTFRKDLTEKMEKIKDDITVGKLSTIKYFKSDSLNIRGEKVNVPKVIIGADNKMLNNVMMIWLKGENRKLTNQPMKFLILEEVFIQLKGFKDYAIRVGQTGVANDIDKVFKIIEEIYNKESASGNREEIKMSIGQDKVYSAIKEYQEKLQEK